MAASVRSTAAQDFGWASGTIEALEASGASSGDVLLLALWTGEGTSLPSESGGSDWTVINDIDMDQDPWYIAIRARVFACLRGSSAPNLTFSRGGSTSVGGGTICIQDADTTIGNIVSDVVGGESQTTSIACPSVTVQTGGGLVALFAFQREGVGTSAPPAGYTEYQDFVTEVTYNGPSGTSAQAGVSGGSHSPGNYTFSNSAQLSVFTVAVGDAAGGGGRTTYNTRSHPLGVFLGIARRIGL